jgi:hypothetical protein
MTTGSAAIGPAVINTHAAARLEALLYGHFLEPSSVFIFSYFCKRSHRKLYACIFGCIFRLDISLWHIFASAPCARLTSLVLPPPPLNQSDEVLVMSRVELLMLFVCFDTHDRLFYAESAATCLEYSKAM